jgi:anti-sigma B factor antagonist/stage II sporulation protein AA (anti-sigma F factor antagonist)
LLEVKVDAIFGVRRVILRGELDMDTIALLHEVVRSEDEEMLELDLSGVSFVDSTGLKGLLDINKSWKQKGSQVLISNPQPDVAEVMRLVGLDKLLGQEGI